jgi:hypothetical protein
MHGVAPHMCWSSSPSIVRRRCRGSLPRHTLLAGGDGVPGSDSTLALAINAPLANSDACDPQAAATAAAATTTAVAATATAATSTAMPASACRTAVAAAPTATSASVPAATAVPGGKLDAGVLGVLLVEDVERGQAHIGDFLFREQHAGAVLLVAGGAG